MGVSNFSHIRHFYNWLYGRCVVINADGKFQKSWETGPRQGLDLLLNIEADEYSETALVSGLRVAVHDPAKLPIVDEDGFDLAPGISASIAVRSVSYLLFQLTKLGFTTKRTC